ncbi:MAG: protein translocase subunit SecD [Planctomycetia bacterium]|nr:protein translocase subunit SecD [Planctomycetia bacterium]
MNTSNIAFGLLAQAAAAIPAAPAVPVPWWRESWALWGITLLTLAVPTFVAWLIAGRLRAADMWGRIATVLVALTAGLVICWMGWPPRLGIDLKGGLILVYEVDTSKQAAARVDDTVRRLEGMLATQEGDQGRLSRRPGGGVTVRLAAGDAKAREAFLAAVAAAEFDRVSVRESGRRSSADALEVDFDVVPEAAPIAMDKLVAAVSRRVNPGGQKEVTVRQYGLDQIEVIIPEVEQSEVDLIKRIVSSAGVLEFRILANREDPRHQAAVLLAGKTAGATVRQKEEVLARWVQLDPAKMDPADDRRLVTRPTPDGGFEVLVMADPFNVTGGDLGRVSPSLDENLSPCVNFTLNSSGAARFGLLTGRNLPDPANGLQSRLGILLDDVLQSAPSIRSTITSSGQITGNFKQPEVDFLVEVLNAGSLPAALRSEPISEQRISSQLGDDTIKSARMAMLLATLLVLTFMLAYYRFSGLVADLAVLLNIVLVMAVMISFKAAFTLAGLAGLVLSVGMAVDANVLIYERMREEIDRGAAVRMAIRNGFQRAFSTIVDSNLTTLITAIVLFAIGTDQLKGFAVTLFFGLLLNLFTAVFCSRVVFDLAERNRWIKTLSMARLFGQTDFRFVQWMKPAIVGSLLVIAAGLVAAWQRGQGLFDIDFTGGTSVQVEFKQDKPLDIGAVRAAVGSLPDAAVSAVSTSAGDADLRYKIDTSLRGDDANDVEAKIRDLFPDRLATYGMEIIDVATAAPPETTAEKPAADEKENESPPAAVTTATLRFPQKISRSTLRATVRAGLEAEKIGDADFDIASTDAGAFAGRPCRDWTLTTTLDPASTRGILEGVKAKLAETPVYLAANTIGGKVAGNTKVTAVYALLASLLMIVLYVWIRFQNVAFGLAAVIALAHDVLVAVACLALSKYVAPFLGWALVDDFKISLDVVAGLLTIIGFSINDTIVIFDRLRELRGKGRFVTSDMVDRAVNQTLSRTILTSGTALLATFILYAFGGQGIHAFAFTMLVGIIVGSYSTIYIASPIVLWLQHAFAGGEQAAHGSRSMQRA